MSTRRALRGGVMALGLALSAGAGAQQVAAPQGPATLEQVQRGLSTTGDELARLEAQGHQLEQEEQGLGPRNASARARVRAQLRVLYHLTQQAPLSLWAGPEVLLEGLSRQATLRRAANASVSELRAVQERAQAVHAEREQTARLLREATERRASLEQARSRLDVLGGGSLSVSNAGLAPEGATPMTVYGGAAQTVTATVARFADAAGRLLFPIAGRAEVRRVQRAGVEGLGLEVVAPLGAPVRAVYTGRVAFADRYGPYGLLVIVDHGEHFYTVSGNLGSIAVQVGQELAAGALVGTVGDEGRGPQLYLEVRRGRETLDPGVWFGVR